MTERVRVLDPTFQAGREQPIMIDRRLRFLRLVAERLQRQLDDHDTGQQGEDTPSRSQRQRLERSAQRARARLAEAEATRLSGAGDIGQARWAARRGR